jgi:hypothetical protein
MVFRSLPTAFALVGLTLSCTRPNPGFGGTEGEETSAEGGSGTDGTTTGASTGASASASATGTGTSSGTITDGMTTGTEAGSSDTSGEGSSTTDSTTTGETTTTGGESSTSEGTTGTSSGTDEGSTGTSATDDTGGTTAGATDGSATDGGTTGSESGETTSGTTGSESGSGETTGDTGGPNVCDPAIARPDWVEVRDPGGAIRGPACPSQLVVVQGLVAYDSGAWSIPDCGDCSEDCAEEPTAVRFALANTGNWTGPPAPPEGTCVRIEVEYKAPAGLGDPDCGGFSGVVVSQFEPDGLLFVASSRVTHAPTSAADDIDATRDIAEPCDCAELDCCVEQPGDYEVTFEGALLEASGTDITLSSGQEQEFTANGKTYRVRDFASYVPSTCDAVARVEWAMRFEP